MIEVNGLIELLGDTPIDVPAHYGSSHETRLDRSAGCVELLCTLALAMVSFQKKSDAYHDKGEAESKAEEDAIAHALAKRRR